MPKEFIPRPYQRYAYNRIIEKPATALMLDMGMGKTVITLTAINDLLYDYFDVTKALVIAPLRVAETTWTDECQQWNHLAGLTISPVIGTLSERVRALKTKADVYTINRENVVWLVDYYGKDWPFDMVVIDESSSFKNHQSKRFKALKRVRPIIKRLVELTGTPAPNGLMDLWSQLYLLDRGKRLGKTIGQYRRQFFKPGAGSGHIVYEWNLQKGAEQEIFNRISDICVSMKSSDYITLPEVMYNIVPVKLSTPVQREYKRLAKDLILRVNDDEIVANTAAALSGKLLQMSSGAVYDDAGHVITIHNAKLEALEDIVSANEHRAVLVFYWFKHDLDRLKEKFPKAVQLKTAADIKAWNSGKISIMLVHPASAGHGLNLQYGGSIIVWFSLSWSLELYQQANKRLHRSGQTHTVVIHHLVAQGTIDEDVMKALQGKKVTQETMITAIKARIKEYGGK
nr:MAG TPA: Chromatin remodeling complex ATPase [Caudoviricetes sp.]